MIARSFGTVRTARAIGGCRLAYARAGCAPLTASSCTSNPRKWSGTSLTCSDPWWWCGQGWTVHELACFSSSLVVDVVFFDVVGFQFLGMWVHIDHVLMCKWSCRGRYHLLTGCLRWQWKNSSMYSTSTFPCWLGSFCAMLGSTVDTFTSSALVGFSTKFHHFTRAGVDSDPVVDSRPALWGDFHVFRSMEKRAQSMLRLPGLPELIALEIWTLLS